MNLKKLNAKKKLTIILTTKGRDEFTYRFMQYIGKYAIPFHIMIGDGAPKKNTPLNLKKIKREYPNISFQYFQYKDNTIFDFYKKLENLSKKVKTEYAMIMDNDDFIVPSAVFRQIDFLNSNPAFVSSGGIVSGFKLSKAKNKNGLFGQIVELKKNYANPYAETCEQYRDRSLAVLYVAKTRLVNYYKIFRVSALVKILSELRSLNFKSLLLFEYYFSMRAESLGKNHLDKGSIYLLRQIGTSMHSAGCFSTLEIIKLLLKTDYSSEFKKMTKTLIAKIKIKNKQTFIDSFGTMSAQALLNFISPFEVYKLINGSKTKKPLFYKVFQKAKKIKYAFSQLAEIALEKSIFLRRFRIQSICSSLKLQKNNCYRKKIVKEIWNILKFLNEGSIKKVK